MLERAEEMDTMLWWYWILIGIVLVIMELVVPSFTIFWFGLGALLTGILVAVLPEVALEWQILVFSASSIAFCFLWFRYFQPRKRAQAGVMDETLAVGQTGIAATRARVPGETGRVVFSVPVLGHESWEYVADEPISTGERLRVIAVVVQDEPSTEGRALPQKVLKVEKVQ